MTNDSTIADTETVYVLCSYQYNDYEVIGVYLKRDSAQEALDVLSEGSEREFEILDMVLIDD